MNKYFNAAQIFSKDISLFQKFNDVSQLTTLLQSSLKLLDIIQKYDEQIRFLQQMLIDFQSIFDSIEEYNDLKTLVDFIVATSDLMKKLDTTFTLQAIFGTSLNNLFEIYFNSLSQTQM